MEFPIWITDLCRDCTLWERELLSVTENTGCSKPTVCVPCCAVTETWYHPNFCPFLLGHGSPGEEEGHVSELDKPLEAPDTPYWPFQA